MGSVLDTFHCICIFTASGYVHKFENGEKRSIAEYLVLKFSEQVVGIGYHWCLPGQARKYSKQSGYKATKIPFYGTSTGNYGRSTISKTTTDFTCTSSGFLD